MHRYRLGNGNLGEDNAARLARARQQRSLISELTQAHAVGGTDRLFPFIAGITGLQQHRPPVAAAAAGRHRRLQTSKTRKLTAAR